MPQAKRYNFSTSGMMAGLLALSGCIFPTDTGQEWQEELDDSRQRWEGQNIQDYYLRQRKTCFCPPEATRLTELEVRARVIVAWRDIETGESVAPEFQSEFLTVIDLFELIQGAIDQNASSLLVEYDPESGLPFDVSVDFDARVADEEVRYENVQITTF